MPTHRFRCCCKSAHCIPPCTNYNTHSATRLSDARSCARTCLNHMLKKYPSLSVHFCSSLPKKWFHFRPKPRRGQCMQLGRWRNLQSDQPTNLYKKTDFTHARKMKIQDACIHPSMHDCRRKNINLQNSSSRHCYTDNELTGPSSSLISINHLDRAPYHIHPCMHAYSLHHVHRAPDPFQQPPPHPCPCRTSTLLCLV